MIRVGDCLDVMRTFDADSVDSIVTDPPYGLGFMGKAWDHAVPGVPFWLEMLRVAKPGAFLAAFGGTRTSHRMACAIEDAGWELRDTLMWVYGSGFPKSHNLTGEYEGWGTALKPAWEPIILARKPFKGTVAANVARYGTGAINIAACRVLAERMPANTGAGGLPRRSVDEDRGAGLVAQPHELGRWPANLIHDGSPEVLAGFPSAPGQSAAVGPQHGAKASVNTFGDYGPRDLCEPRGDSGSAARFFYCAKADRADRNDGCDSIDEKPSLKFDSTSAFAKDGRRGSGMASNNHPTVKPTDLMRWLCRLVTPPGGLILDPFTGSGSTGRGAIAEGFRFQGIELDADYAAIAMARIRAMQPGLSFGAAA